MILPPHNRGDLSAAQWKRIAPNLPPQKPAVGRPNNDHQTIINALYRMRNRVKRCFNRLKQYRRIATRYEKMAENYLTNVSSTKCEKDNFRQILICRNPHSFVAEFLTPLPRCAPRSGGVATAGTRCVAGTKSSLGTRTRSAAKPSALRTPNFELTLVKLRYLENIRSPSS